ncbi:splicing factor 3B subunit 4-like [Acropora millepora]|nr:splicing factor 3B subunit 4-like [Acropora millepora]
MAAGPIAERNQDATIYVGGLDEKVTETLLWELFLQGGPVVNVHMPKDRITQLHQGYGFIEFLGEEDADYAIKVMNMIKVYGKPIRVNKASAHNKNLDVGANIFIGNLDPEIDEKLLYDTFSAFGVILQTPKIMRDPETGNSKGFAFINFASFDASDAAMEAMNGQYLCNRPITISYAFKKESKGERHGSAAERLLAAQNPLAQADRPHQLFADAPPTPVSAVPPPAPAMMPPPVMTIPVPHSMPGLPPMPPPGGPPFPPVPPGMPPPGMPPHGMMPPPGFPGMHAMPGMPPPPGQISEPQPPPPPPPGGQMMPPPQPMGGQFPPVPPHMPPPQPPPGQGPPPDHPSGGPPPRPLMQFNQHGGRPLVPQDMGPPPSGMQGPPPLMQTPIRMMPPGGPMPPSGPPRFAPPPPPR